MRVLAVVPALYDTSPGQRFRMEQWAPRLREYGIDVRFAPFETPRLHEILYGPGRVLEKTFHVARACARRAALARQARGFDVVYVFREAALLGPAFFEWLIGRSGTPVVFDFDDAVFEPYVSPANGWLSLLKCPGKTSSICRIAEHVIAGNAYLASYARRFNQRVTIVPTTIDTDQYRPHARPPSRPLVIGWTGSYSTVQHLRRIDNALRRIAAVYDVKLRVIGTPGYELQGMDVTATPWRARTEIRDLQQIDIGLMPLPDDRWSRGKCGLKALQYMALGIPTVCSPVGVNAEIIRHGANGLLATTDDEWVDCLRTLIESHTLRARLGAAGRATVEARYSAAVQAPAIAELLASVARNNAI